MIYDIRSPFFRHFITLRFRVKKTDSNHETAEQMLTRFQTKLQKPMGPSGSV